MMTYIPSLLSKNFCGSCAGRAPSSRRMNPASIFECRFENRPKGAKPCLCRGIDQAATIGSLRGIVALAPLLRYGERDPDGGPCCVHLRCGSTSRLSRPLPPHQSRKERSNRPFPRLASSHPFRIFAFDSDLSWGRVLWLVFLPRGTGGIRHVLRSPFPFRPASIVPFVPFDGPF